LPARRQLLISHSQSQLKKSTDTASVCTSDLNPLFGSKEKSINDGEPVRVREGDLDGSGALLSGERVNLQLTAAGADLNNVSGTIAGRNAVRIDARNSINSRFGRFNTVLGFNYSYVGGSFVNCSISPRGAVWIIQPLDFRWRSEKMGCLWQILVAPLMQSTRK